MNGIRGAVGWPRRAAGKNPIIDARRSWAGRGVSFSEEAIEPITGATAKARRVRLAVCDGTIRVLRDMAGHRAVGRETALAGAGKCEGIAP